MLHAKNLLGITVVLCLGGIRSLYAQECAANQHPCTAYVPTFVSATVTVPATTSELPTNILMKKGMRYRLSASGVIRVGMPFEGDTTPDGWYTQDFAGSGYPAPDAYKYGLIVKFGSGGIWQWAGSGVLTVSLGSQDPDGSPMIFGINDNVFRDNTGEFIVTVAEVAPNLVCCPNQNAPAFTPSAYFGISKGKAANPPKGVGNMPKMACGSKTPDGKLQWFFFDVYCGSSYSRTIPIEACTNEEALPLALPFVAGGPCYLTQIKGKPIPLEPRNPEVVQMCAESLFKFCIKCDSTVTTVSAFACSADLASKKILDARPSICSVKSAGECPP